MGKRIPANKFNHEDFLNKFYKDSWNNDYEVISEYVRMLDRVTIRHKECGHEFTRIASKTTPKVKCPKCYKGNRGKRTHKMFLDEMSELVGEEYFVIGEYINTDTKVVIKHNVCGHEYGVEPNSFINAGSRCPSCAGTIKWDNKRFLDTIEELPYRDEYVFIEPYDGYDTKLEVTHKICGHTYSVTPNKFIELRRCPKCNNSRGEKKVSYFLDTHGVDYIMEKTFPDLLSNGVRLRYDFYLPKENLLIEYDGSQHYRVKTHSNETYAESLERFKGMKYRDKSKDEYALKNGIDMIRIKYTEYDNVDKILEGILLD